MSSPLKLPLRWDEIWRAKGESDGWEIVDNKGTIIATGTYETGHEAKQLVHAANTHSALVVALEEMMETTEEPPEPSCTCHINPPCDDCVDFLGLRVAREMSLAALALAKWES